jgi:hypothetical protein
MLNSLPVGPATCAALHQGQLFNARPIYWLCVVNPFVYEMVHRQSPSHGLPTPVDR